MAAQPAQQSQSNLLAPSLARASRQPHPLHQLVEVLRWELRRILASRGTWIQAVLLLGVCLLLLGFSMQSASFPQVQTPTGVPVLDGQLSRNTPWGLSILFPNLMIEFGLFLPFVTADGVSLDVRRRTHELLMTTPVPSWAYVWGRYLARMLIALGMAVVFLLAILAMGLELHVVQPIASSDTGSYVNPELDVPGTIAIWAAIALPPTVLLGSLSFALGILLPRLGNLIKSSVVFAWLVGGLFLPAYLFSQVRYNAAFNLGNPPAWWMAYENLTPITTDAGHLFLERFLQHLYAIVNNAALSNQAIQQQAQALTQQMPDLASFVWLHLVGVAVSLVIVLGAALSFRRYRNVVT